MAVRSALKSLRLCQNGSRLLMGDERNKLSCVLLLHTSPLTADIENMDALKQPVVIPDKLLLGPGPTNLSPRVKKALAWPDLGHLHPEFCQILDQSRAGLQYAFGTENACTLAISGTGHAGMEAAFINLLEPGDTVLVLENGIWGQRAASLAERLGFKANKLVNEPGNAFSLSQIEEGLAEHRPTVLFVCHGESSSGVLQPLEGIGELCRKYGTYLVVDTVASLLSTPFNADKLQIDVVYSATQKAMSGPTGMAPITFNERAWNKASNRTSPITSFYFNIINLANYWGCFGEQRAYHHTGPIQNVYGMREACAQLAEEGLDNYVQRHVRNTAKLWEGIEKLGLKLFVKNPAHRNPAVTTIQVPEGVDWQAVIGYLMKNHRIEIAGGLGPTAGKVWRIGLMGTNSNQTSVDRVLSALAEALSAQNFKAKV